MLNFIRDIHRFFCYFCISFCGRLRNIVINRQDYDNTQRKNDKEAKTNRTKIEIEAVMTREACIAVLPFVYSSDTVYLETEDTVPGEGNKSSHL